MLWGNSLVQVTMNIITVMQAFYKLYNQCLPKFYVSSMQTSIIYIRIYNKIKVDHKYSIENFKIQIFIDLQNRSKFHQQTLHRSTKEK